MTLRIGTDDNPGRPAAEQIEEFGRRVSELSEGRIRIEPVWHAAGPRGVRDWDQRVARKVVAGELDLGLIPARAWDTEGVTTLRALHAPLLVASDELLERVLTSELADTMLAGLKPAGVVGLALLPEGMRHPFSYGEPLLGPADYAGALVRAPRSETSYAMFEALGARADDPSEEEFQQQIVGGSLGAAESGFALAGSLQANTIATGNVVFFPKVQSLVVDANVFEDLDDQQRRILEDAAIHAREWAFRTMPSEADAAKRYCDTGGRVALASESDLAALEEAVAPVYAELERDEETRSLIADIRDLESEIPASATAIRVPCGDAPAPAPAERGRASALDGVYRTSFTRGALARSPLLEDPGEVHDQNWGDFTLTFERGRVTFEQENDVASSTTSGTFRFEGDTIVLEFTEGGNFGEAFTFRWQHAGDELTFERVGASPTPYVIQPWRRVGAGRSAFPEGVYRVELPLDFLTGRGLDAGAAFGQAGINTLTFDDGRWLHHLEGPANPGDCRGTYAVEQGRVALRVGPGQTDGCGLEGFEIFNARWALEKGELRFVDVDAFVDDYFAETIWGSKPWRRIG